NQARCLKNQPALNPLEYEAFINAVDDESDSSNFWSDDEDEEEMEDSEDESPAQISPLISFSHQGKTYELYRRLLSRINIQNITAEVFKNFIRLASNSTWAIILIKSGRVFAGIYDFKTEKFTKKKSFKRYTERKKQGGSQMLRDKSG